MTNEDEKLSVDEEIIELLESRGDPIEALKSRIDSPATLDSIENPQYAEKIIRAARVITSELQNYIVSVMTFERSAEEEYVLGEVTFTKAKLLTPVTRLALSYQLAWENLCLEVGLSQEELASAINYELNPASIQVIEQFVPELTPDEGVARDRIETLLGEPSSRTPAGTVH